MRSSRKYRLCSLPILFAIASALGCGKQEAPELGASSDGSEKLEPLPIPSSTIRFEDGCMTSQCHRGHAEAAIVHAPVQARRCDLCHSPDIGGHQFPLLDVPDALCASCHETGDTREFQHGVLRKDGCLACHESHSGATRALLKKPQEKEICADCHLPAQGLNRHEPYDEDTCSTCHDPHEADTKALLRGKNELEHCGICHAEEVASFDEGLSTHKNVEHGCLACHEHHASPQPKLMKDEPGRVCLSCHEEITKAIGDSPIGHEAVMKGKRCLSCHEPHATNRPKFLRANQAQICLSCHDKDQEAPDGRVIHSMKGALENSKFRHGPVRAEDCTSCHAVHGARHEHLLKKAAPDLLRGAFDIKHFALCFDCHTQQLVLEEKTRISTQFRDGDRNLHFIHIRKNGRGRSCTTCHSVHGSNQGRHIAQSIFFEGSDWKMKLEFKLTKSGGSCVTECHETLSYSRNKKTGQD